MRSDPGFKQALILSYRLLSYRPRSIYEIRSKLKEKGYRAELIEKVIERLKRLNYLDDEAFAKFWVESKMRIKPVGSPILKRDLKRRGLGEELIGKTLKDKEADYDEFEIACGVAQKRLDYYRDIPRPKAKRRLYDYLLRRGYSFYTVRRVMEKLFNR